MNPIGVAQLFWQVENSIQIRAYSSFHSLKETTLLTWSPIGTIFSNNHLWQDFSWLFFEIMTWQEALCILSVGGQLN